MMRYGFGSGGFGIMGGTWGFLMTLFMLMLIVLAVLGIVALVRYLQKDKSVAAPAENSALLILNERYARGELNDEEYAVKKATLMK